ncbi:MAG: hypothetical protein LWW79_02660 [Holophagaceae bacterium]|nr:hypothetical protein [Holophagaceae bacterium]
MDDLRDGLRERWGLLTLGVAAAALGLWWWQGRPHAQPAGVLAPEDPLQGAAEPAAPWTFRNHRITPLARFEVRARVLGVERYRFDRAAELSPVDLALGWGPMSDSRVLQDIRVTQRDRWFFWSAVRLSISPAAVMSHAANMHLIPATAAVERRLLAVKPGQLVTLRGQLVRADGQDGWHWVSSLTRTDTGDGSCEVVWVESAAIADR